MAKKENKGENGRRMLWCAACALGTYLLLQALGALLVSQEVVGSGGTSGFGVGRGRRDGGRADDGLGVQNRSDAPGSEQRWRSGSGDAGRDAGGGGIC